MNRCYTVLKWASGLLAGLVMMSAHAEMVGYPAGTLYDSTTFVTGPSLNVTTLNVNAPGTLTIKLTDLQWPEALGSLSFSLTSATNILGAHTGAGTFSYDVEAAGSLFASIFATGGGESRTGLYGVNVNFAPLAPVPLPAAGLLLASGLAGFGALRKKRTVVTSAA
jgi:hypothetical protein